MIFMFILLLLLAFIAGVLASPKIAATTLAQINFRTLSRVVDHWANRYQTFLGVMVAIAVAYLTISAMSKQNSISERQFLSGQMQSLLGDKGTLHLTRVLRSDLLMIDAKNYPALRNFYQLVRTGDEEQIILQPVGAQASN